MAVKSLVGCTIYFFLSFFEFNQTILLFLVGVISVCDRAIWPATSVLLKQLFKNDLLRINSLGSMCSQAGYIIGSSLSGLIIATAGNSAVFFIYSVIQIISVFCFFFIVVTPEEYEVEKISNTKNSSFNPSNLLIISAMLQSILFAVLNALNVLLTPFCSEILKVGAEGLGFIDSAWAIGAVIGGAITVLYTKKMMNIRNMVIQVTVLSCLVGIFGLSDGLIQPILIYIALGCLFVVSRVGMETNIQLLTPNNHLAQLKGNLSSINSFISLMIYLSVSIFATIENLRNMYIYFGILIFLGVLIAVSIWYVRHFYLASCNIGGVQDNSTEIAYHKDDGDM